MKIIPSIILMMASIPIFAQESVVHDDGTGAQISFYLPTRDFQNGRTIEYTSFSISVIKDNKFLLHAALVGSKTEDGTAFSGTIIIPSAFINSAEITMAGSPPNSSLGVSKKVKVSTFKTIHRPKSWTDQN